MVSKKVVKSDHSSPVLFGFLTQTVTMMILMTTIERWFLTFKTQSNPPWGKNTSTEVTSAIYACVLLILANISSIQKKINTHRSPYVPDVTV